MLLATMPPLLLHPILHVWTRSLARRRIRAVALFLFANTAVWMAVGCVLAAGALAMRMVADLDAVLAAAVATGIALVWQATPVKQTCLNRCHRLPPLAAFGIAADLDCLRFGAQAGAWCVGSCWALMLAALMAGDAHGFAMLAVAAVSSAERMERPRPARWRMPLGLPVPLRRLRSWPRLSPRRALTAKAA
jgi:predicted metal-binding membrane protein